MIYTWYEIFNKTTFVALGLVSKNYSLNLEGIGQKNILVLKGNTIGIVYNDVFLSLETNNENPFVFDDIAVYIDENDDVFIGFPDES